MNLEASILLLLAATCFMLGAAISKGYPLSYAATTTTLSLWAAALFFGLIALVIVVRLIAAAQ